MHSLQPESSDAEEAQNPWISHSDDQHIPSTTTPGNSYHPNPVCSLGNLVSPELTTERGDHHMLISPSPPQSIQPIPAFLPMQSTQAPQTDPHVASLKAIFPDFDDAVILSVLESTDNDHDRALDVLLGMNDPSFMQPVPPSASPNNHFQTAPSIDAQRQSQEALDEQLARRLALEEQQQAAAPTWQPQGVEGQSIYQTYQPRRGGRPGGGWSGWSGGQGSWGGQPQVQSQPQGQGGKDTMTEFQEGFNRIAESGKKTFSSIMTKVRAKMQEFDQGQGWSGSQNPPFGQVPQQDRPSYYTPPQPQGSEQNAYTQAYQPPQSVAPQRQTSQSRPTWTSVSPPRSGVLSPTAVEPMVSEGRQQSSYYDPNARGYDLYDNDEEIQIIDKTTPSTTPAAPVSIPAQRSVTPPQTNNTTSPPPLSETSSPPSYPSPVTLSPSHSRPSSASSLPARSLSPPTKQGAPAGVDFSKLGLLPKRPISLVRPQSPPATGGDGASTANAPRVPVAVAHSQSTADSSTDREEPEFVENPFEDPK